MNELQQLDEILRYLRQISIEVGTQPEIKYLVSTSRADEQTSVDIMNGLKKRGIEIGNYDLNLMLFHLARVDNYILESVIEGYEMFPSFRIVFAGKLFIENGGYVRQKRTKRANYIYQSITNICLIFGGVAAGLYYLYELYKMLTAPLL